MKKINKEIDGFRNLFFIISFLNIVRYFIEDFNEFGLIFNIPLSSLNLKDIFYFILTLLILTIRSLMNFYLVNFYYLFSICNLLISEFFIILINLKYLKHVYLSGWALILNIILLAKLTSFNSFFRSSERILKLVRQLKSKKNLSTTKFHNIKITQTTIKFTNHKKAKKSCKIANFEICTFKHFLYFIISPTLCYSQKYNTKLQRDYKKMFYKAISLLTGIFIFVFVCDQYSIPSIYRILKNESLFIVLENAINLTFSTVFLFLIFFQLVFVCCLDLISEITKFSNTEFYQKWWNSTTVAQFWTLWNIPVHLWIKKHIYIPLKKRSASKIQAQSAAFLVSAFFHEYVLSISTKQFCGYAFLGMMAQVPLILISDWVNKKFPKYSNYFFWGSFCIIGHPLIAILYVRSKELK